MGVPTSTAVHTSFEAGAGAVTSKRSTPGQLAIGCAERLGSDPEKMLAKAAGTGGSLKTIWPSSSWVWSRIQIQGLLTPCRKRSVYLKGDRFPSLGKTKA